MCENINEYPEKIKLYNAIPVCKDNIAVERIEEKCIDCGLCKTICENREGIEEIRDGKACVNCGQCIQACPVGALKVRSDIEKFNEAVETGKVCIAFLAPAVKVSIGDSFKMSSGEYVEGKIISALKKIGFEYVLDVSSGADFTVVEEAAELINRINNKGTLPMFTSCCPSWVKYAEMFYPELLPNLSTCKSPISMLGAVAKTYICEKLKLNDQNVFTVAITPCTAKKYEVSRKELIGTDIVLTAKELVNILKDKDIDFVNLDNGKYDKLGMGSGAGLIFGTSGGVTEAVLRTVYKIMTGNDLSKDKMIFQKTRGMNNVKELSINIKGKNLNIAIINQMSSALPILEDVKKGISEYHFIEIMNCLGGCIGGGGLPAMDMSKEMKIKKARSNSLYKEDNQRLVKISYKNSDVAKVYMHYFDHPLSNKSKDILHTYYINRQNEIK